MKELQEFVEKTDFGSEPLRLNVCSIITDRRAFAESHLAVLKANSGNKIAMPYYERLVLFYKLVKDGN